MDLSVDAPIAALASPPGSSMRGIVRISGGQVRGVIDDWFTADDRPAWDSAEIAMTHSGRLQLPDSGQFVDIPVHVLYWPTRRSYTGQPLIELHLPGSPSLLEAVLGEVHRRGARPARPGEFTMRAFLAGKLDLLQAEAVLGVIDAADHQELQTALAQLAGGVSSQLGRLRVDLLELLADLEAGLDFVDEDIEFVSRDDVQHRVASARTFVDELLQQTQSRMQSRVRPKVVLAGLPNAGKSTLFNRLTGSHSALVSAEQGTTRDFLVCETTWNGLAIDLVDTAGWEDQSSGIMAAAQHHRSQQLQRSDLLVWCTSADLNVVERERDDRLYGDSRSQSNVSLRVLTKIDANRTVAGSDSSGDQVIRVSAVTGEGIAELQNTITSKLSSESGQGRKWLGMTASRCRETLESVSASLLRAEQAAQRRDTGDEIIAIDLRDALEHLGAILGVIYTDDILDRIFSKFCIGK